MTFKQFAAEQGIRAEITTIDRRPDAVAGEWTDGWSGGRHADGVVRYHWRVVFRQSRHTRSLMTVYYTTGELAGEPTVADVLECIASDALSVDSYTDGFEDWATEYGYNTDSRRAERTYNACKRNARKLNKFLTVEQARQIAGLEG